MKAIELQAPGRQTLMTVAVHEAPAGADRKRIAEFLASRNGPLHVLSPAWMEILRSGLQQRPYYLEARAGDKTVGVLPLAHVKSWLFGRYLVSLPYINHAGPLADDSQTMTLLIDQAVELADQLDVKYLELRNRTEVEHPKLTEMRTSKVLMWRELPATADELWASLKPEVRNQVRKGEKAELTVDWGGGELIDPFYEVFSRNMRDLGTPVFGKRLFEAMRAALGDGAEFCVVRLKGLPIAAAVLLHGPGFTEVPSASSLREHNKTCANMLLYHRLLVRAIERGQKVFDFGRSSPDSGTFKFKKQWGAAPQPSVWQYYVRKGDISDVRPDNPKYRRKIELWKKLPLWLTRLIGPRIIRGVP